MNNNLNINGKVIAITRPAERSQKAVDIVEKYGGIAMVAPTLEIQVSNSESLINLCKIADKLDWMIFTSPTGILSIIKHCKDLKERLNPNCKIAVIGPRTEKYLNEHGLDADIVPEDYTAEGLLKIFKDINVRNKKIGIPRTMAARDVLPNGLKAMGAEVLMAEAYKSAVPKDKKNVKKLINSLIDKDVDAVTFTSTLTVKNLFEVAEEEGRKGELVKSLQNNVLVAAIGPVTAKPLENEGITAITPDEYTVKAMLEKLFGKMIQAN